MISKLGRLFFLVIFSLIIIGFYSTDKIVQAKGEGEAKSDGDWTVFGTDMYSNVTGNVGIGVSDPGVSLDVAGSIRLRGGNPLWLGDIGDVGRFGMGYTVVGSTDTLRIINSAYSNLLTIEENGNVGIGTTGPSSILDIEGHRPIVEITNTDTTGHVLNITKLQLHGGREGQLYFANPSDSSYDGYISYNHSGLDFDFVTQGVTRVSIGNFGVVNTGPYKTTYWGTSNAPNFSHSTDSNTGLVFVSTDSLALSTAGTMRLFVAPAGNVGIGTTNPGSWKLRVSGGSAAVDTGQSWTTTSDRRLKKDITNLGSTLDKVSRIRGIKYHTFKEEKSDPTHIGFVAQEVEEEFPEVVIMGEDGYKGIDYGRVTAILLEAVKELKVENDTVKAENEQLREKLTALADRQEAIEDMFLAISTNLSKDKLVKFDQAELDEVQKTIQ